jgi:hypothetical protein
MRVPRGAGSGYSQFWRTGDRPRDLNSEWVPNPTRSAPTGVETVPNPTHRGSRGGSQEISRREVESVPN